jgi:hypothetical protein
MMMYKNFILPDALGARLAESGDAANRPDLLIARILADYAAAPAAENKPLPRLPFPRGGNCTIEVPATLVQALVRRHPDLGFERAVVRALYLHFNRQDISASTVRHNCRLPAPVLKRVEAEAFDAGCSADMVLRHAIAEYLYGFGGAQFPHRLMTLPRDLNPDLPLQPMPADFPEESLDAAIRIWLPPAFIARAKALLLPPASDKGPCSTVDHVFASAVFMHLSFLRQAPPAPAADTRLHDRARRAPRLGR